MERVRRPHPSVEIRRAIISRFGESGLGVEAFCLRESISLSSFYRWRSLLDDSSRSNGATPRASKPGPNTAGFVALGTLRGADAALELRLDLGGGVVLQLVRG